ncbi:tyrosine-protein phosphatase [Nocardioides immobilis]|uniref:Tyrosine-protein phosphatase n=1 Tax=Nocardioides immobilis TaxID=2049295 RepID=A0A417Y034_9ACTN|nr:tyrosine-protein phosphatase [Nocardioides immobilis]RHW26010.1 tyrosine-protein phosphatase [Nocardioides immobilis]
MTSSSNEILRLASADNFRDVAGPGYATLDGARVRQGVFYRSNELRLTDADHGTLAGLGLRAVLDLRSALEIERHPDVEVPGADWHNFDVSGIPMDLVAELRDRRSAVELMDRVYRSFVESEDAREEFGGLFHQLATGGPQLFHCTAGKDRTGWVAALLLHIAGVDDPTIESDYLLTNELTSSSRARVEAEIVSLLGAEHVASYEPTLVADLEYLRSGYDAVEQEYGDRTGYLHDGLGLDDATLETLRDLLRDQ